MSGIQAIGRLGASGEFRLVRMRSPQPGKAHDFWDLWEGNPVDGFKPRAGVEITEDLRFKNKFTKRGLARMMHETLVGHGGSYVPSDITYEATARNPFLAFFMTADSPSGDTKLGDERPEFDESDGQFDTRISSNTGTVAEGRRGLLLSDVSGILRRISLAYRSTSPYGEAEMIFYVEPSTPDKATGTINAVAVASLVEGTDYFTVGDGHNPDLVFEFDNDITYTGGRIPVDIAAATTADDVAAAIVAAITREYLSGNTFITASASGATVTLTHTLGGTMGNVQTTLTENVTDGGFSVVAFAGGANANETGDDGLDNFPIKSVGLAYGVACGDGEADSQVGVRAVVGLAPTFQGVSDRAYCHEAQAEGEDLIPNEYTYPDVGGPAASAAGYIQSGKLTEVQVDSDITASGAATDFIVASTKRIQFRNAPVGLVSTWGFHKTAHQRKVLEISGSGTAGNNRRYTIKDVISPWEVEVFEAPAADDDGSSNPLVGKVYQVYEGYNCFDGRIENEGRVEAADHDTPGEISLGEYWSSADDAGTHVIGRVFSATKTLTGIRIVVPKGVNKDFVPDNFTIQVLDSTANGGSPRPGDNSDWVTVSGGIYTTQATTIFDSGVYGTEYTFDAISARGVRLFGMQASSSSRHVHIAALMAFEDMSPVTLASDVLRLKVKSPDSYRDFALPDVTSATGVDTLVAALNEVLRGYQLEAVRSELGFLWVRGTVAGNNSDVFLDSQNNGSSANLKLGLETAPATAPQRTGVTQAVIKYPEEALTIIYRVNLTGNVPGGWV